MLSVGTYVSYQVTVLLASLSRERQISYFGIVDINVTTRRSLQLFVRNSLVAYLPLNDPVYKLQLASKMIQ
jgi:hypothetical protein